MRPKARTSRARHARTCATPFVLRVERSRSGRGWRRTTAGRCSTALPGVSRRGRRGELAPWLASHMDVNALDVTGADGDVPELERAAADNVKRVVRGRPDAQSPWDIAAFLELKTVWHPVGQ